MTLGSRKLIEFKIFCWGKLQMGSCNILKNFKSSEKCCSEYYFGAHIYYIYAYLTFFRQKISKKIVWNQHFRSYNLCVLTKLQLKAFWKTAFTWIFHNFLLFFLRKTASAIQNVQKSWIFCDVEVKCCIDKNKYPVLGVLVFLPRKFLDFWHFVPRSRQFFLVRFARFCKHFQDRGGKSKTILDFLARKPKTSKILAREPRKFCINVIQCL